MPTETAPTTEQTTPQTTEQAPAQNEPQAQGRTPTTTPALFDEGEQGGNSDGQQQATPEQQQQGQQNETPQALKAEDITLPEGYEYDKELGDSFLEILNEAKISKETAQKTLNTNIRYRCKYLFNPGKYSHLVIHLQTLFNKLRL